MTQRHAGFLRLLILFGLLVAITLLVHLLYVAWPWPDTARGTGALQHTVETEWKRIAALARGPSAAAIAVAAKWTYRVGFEWTGLDYLVRTAADPAPLKGPDEAMRRFVLGLWTFFETAYWSIQLVGLRLGVLLVSLPLFLLAGLGAGADGVVSWYLRRTGGGRESGFIYHRAKFALWGALLALWAVYLVPPVPIDPVRVIPPFVVWFAFATRLAIAWFKKYI